MRGRLPALVGMVKLNGGCRAFAARRGWVLSTARQGRESMRPSEGSHAFAAIQPWCRTLAPPGRESMAPALIELLSSVPTSKGASGARGRPSPLLWQWGVMKE